MLYPIMSKSRTVIDLSGIWDFKLGSKDFENNISFMNSDSIAVPASYNDQKDTEQYRNHYGWVYYRRTFYVSGKFSGERIVLRFDAVTHLATIILNGKGIASHKGGFLPFDVDITDKIDFDSEQELIVCVDNKINHSTLPVGNESTIAFFGSDNAGIPSVEAGKAHKKKGNVPNFDFFNFSGINRPVRLCIMPKEYIKDITIVTDLINDTAKISYDAEVCGKGGNFKITILDEDKNEVAYSEEINGVMELKRTHLWQPYPEHPYLYTARLEYGEDVYFQTFGISTVEVKGTQFLINGRPFYFKGAGKHEDSPFHGRGIDLCLDVKDINLMHLIGANSFRTSHYPYAEEMYQLCDKEGIVIIDETPAVGIGGGDNPYKTFHMHQHHEDVIRNLISRDKNHLCVVMWSLGNEPEVERYPQDAYDYWQKLYKLAHKLDHQSRPVTFVCCQNDYKKDIVTRTMDVVCINRYYGWYNLSGDLDAACYAFDVELDFWEKQNKPVILTEYGADAVSGLHRNVPQMFSEEYQWAYYEKINEILDKRDFIIGEHPWNFADFDTFDGCMRVGGNKKGLFTRNRNPKSVVRYFKHRWSTIPNFN
ncbi:MAG: beta-glucuronidase [Clostridiales bacterium]|nr:beta-glucuronidase [Clostridiales bacterium]